MSPQDTEHDPIEFRARCGVKALESDLVPFRDSGNQPDQLRRRQHSVSPNPHRRSVAEGRGSRCTGLEFELYRSKLIYEFENQSHAGKCMFPVWFWIWHSQRGSAEIPRANVKSAILAFS